MRIKKFDRSPAEYQEGGMMGEDHDMSPQAHEAVLQMKKMHEEASQKGDMEKVGQVEMMIKELYEDGDEGTRKMIDEFFPELDFLGGMEETEGDQMMKGGGAMLYQF